MSIKLDPRDYEFLLQEWQAHAKSLETQVATLEAQIDLMQQQALTVDRSLREIYYGQRKLDESERPDKWSPEYTELTAGELQDIALRALGDRLYNDQRDE